MKNPEDINYLRPAGRCLCFKNGDKHFLIRHDAISEQEAETIAEALNN